MNGAVVRRSLQVLGDEIGSVRPAMSVGCAVASFLPDDSCYRVRGGLMRAMGFDIDWSSYFASVPKLSGAGPLTDRLRVGRHCYVNVGCHFDLSDRITIGDRVAIGQQVLILTSTHELGPETSRAGDLVSAPVTIEDGVWIGARAILLGGITIGHGSIVAAGAVVTGNVSSNTLVAGVPATTRRRLTA